MSKNTDIIVDQSAIDRIAALRTDAGNTDFGDNTMLRITVTSGGCSGFQYIMEPSVTIAEDDIILENSIVTDEVSADIMKGSTITFKDDMIGAQFVVDNPNAQSGCGCGASFSVDLG